MNNAKLKNITGLFKDTRTRTIIIFTGVILAIAIIMGLVRFFGQSAGPESQAQVAGPANIQSIPGGFDKPVSAEYAQLQEKQNQLQAQMAAKQGTSSVPTIIRSSSFGQTGQTAAGSSCCSSCCGQQPGGAFPPKVASDLKPGTLIYDANGNVIGTLGPDGKVRNANGLVIGTVGPDGLVRDINGNIIGAAGNTPMGTPVYDANGKLIGTVGPDGKVRDANGNILGTVGPDGLVRDANGNVVGKAVVSAHPANAGRPVYDSQGRLIGYAGADGKVRDLSGKEIGTVGADGVVRDASGNVIGTAGDTVPGTPVYDSNGRLIGVVGADGKVRDANGNILGTVGPDGVVRDASGNVVGKTGPTITGTPAYDAQGRLIGIVGPDGKVRDANGKVVGTVGIDGVVRDTSGNPIGSTNVGTAAAGGQTAAANLAATAANVGGIPGVTTLPGQGGQTPQLQVLVQRQQALISAQKADQLKNQFQGAMAGQANQLLAAWGPPTQGFVAGIPTKEELGAAGQLGGAGAAGVAGTKPPAVKAGSIMFAVLMTSINTDEPGPILATIVEGKFKGGRLIGSIQNQGRKVQLNFNTLTLPDIPTSIPINAIAIDEKTARTAFSSKTDNHYLLRYGSLFASSFIEGYGQATLTSGTTVINSQTATQVSSPNLSPKGKFQVALGNVGNRYGSIAGNLFNTPPTVYVYPGTAMGILFLSDLAALPTPTPAG